MKTTTKKELKKKFIETFIEEFDDPNESFMDYMLDLIPKNVLLKVLEVGNKHFYSQFSKYK